MTKGMRTPGRFVVVEYSNSFALVDKKNHKTRWLSDGVDCVKDEQGNIIPPGTTGFCALWSKMCNDDVEETLEAYWPRKGE